MELNRYKLKAEHKNLFANLAKGHPLTVGDAFRSADPTKPSRKSYSSDDIAGGLPEEHERLLRALVDAGFVEVEAENVAIREKP